MNRLTPAFCLLVLCVVQLNSGSNLASADEPKAAAKKAPQATGELKMLPGFKAELVYNVPRDSQGSWVSMTTDPQGRLIASAQNGYLYRLTLPSSSDPKAEVKVEKINLKIGRAQGLLCAFGNLYVAVNSGAEPKSGLYRVMDTDGDDQYDKFELLRSLRGSSEHGPHGIVLSPDGKSLYISCGNATRIPDPETSRVPRVWAGDLLIERQKDAKGFGANMLATGGWVAKTDPDGKSWELITTGFRNQYDIAFNTDGELFTFDADMEWDMGAPWYRPTRVNLVPSGGEYGWRSLKGKWPAYYPDSLPAVVDIGPGSPTGIAFGTGAKFPAKYQKSLYLCDWSYGIIYAVHLKPDGASYSGDFETFITAAPLPVTDVVMNPKDQALYFTVGGRGVHSALYRVTYTGDESTAAVKPSVDPHAKDRALRHKLEALHIPGAKNAVDTAWPYLSHDDRWIRFAARIAIEHQPVDSWKERVLSETNARALIHASIALARHGNKEEAGLQQKMVDALGRIDMDSLSDSEQTDLMRTYGLVFMRLGAPSDSIRKQVIAEIDPHWPAGDEYLNREMARVMIYLEAPSALSKSLALLAKAPTQEDQIDYVLSLRNLKTPWTIEQRRTYFNWFLQASEFGGGLQFHAANKSIRDAALLNLNDEEKTALADLLAKDPNSAAAQEAIEPRKFVKEWTVAELLAKVEKDNHPRDFEKGRQLFAAASCYKCHRFGGHGGTIGPDLTGVGGRFTVQNLLESVVEPSRVISDQYGATIFEMKNGKVISGHIANLGGDGFDVMTNMLQPGKVTNVKRADIEEMEISTVSMMPTGLLDTLTEAEALDLISYLRSGGDPNHQLFKKLGSDVKKE